MMNRTAFATILAAQADGRFSANEAHIERALRHRRIALCAHAWSKLCNAGLQAAPNAERCARQSWPASHLPPAV
ncbi:hypothetical protein [Pseudoduganella rivuli]|uniref:hypothetical protein n=1 Tax=Pseudoduganella rivuli TaxID=2666085 RepID=UPI0018A1FCDA|nr:hypothetical protein [Pseudoduganella rivuli]